MGVGAPCALGGGVRVSPFLSPSKKYQFELVAKAALSPQKSTSPQWTSTSPQQFLLVSYSVARLLCKGRVVAIGRLIASSGW